MPHLYELLQEKVTNWRKASYPINQYDAIGEILEYATLPESNDLRYLRAAQLRALETYWYLRLVEGTPHIFDLYLRYYPKTTELLNALGLDSPAIRDFVMDEGKAELWGNIRAGGEFVKRNRLQSIHETLTLDYPSYILALAMGAGKTMLIGAIIATEFAMALEYHPKGEGPFIQNALVFAPGLTILESLRELAEVDYSKIIPPRLFKAFDTSYKLIFTQDGQKDLPVIRGSRYNLIVSNTEKIRIQKKTRRHHTWTDQEYLLKVEQATEEANLRLQAIASLPNLGVFSDEAHHTYGVEIGKRLKRVRQTVDYLHENTSLICVVNTTGTPYYQRQPLRDVVIWYGLSQGISDNILKSVDDNIYAYDFDNQHTDQFVSEVVRDFFDNYGDVSLPNGAPAKLAMYFPQNKDLNDLRPVVEQSLMALGYPIDIVLRNTNQSSQGEIDAFNRLNDPSAPHRVILLVNKGGEGWNCLSLFACALARKLTGSNNFVLQAGSRCLRQVPGNTHKARIYLSMDNRGVLDQQLQETYGETIDDLRKTSQNTGTRKLIVRKIKIPPLVVKKLVRNVVPTEGIQEPPSVSLRAPETEAETVIIRQTFSPGERADATSALQQVAETEIASAVDGRDLYHAATEFSAIYRLDLLPIYTELKRLYGPGGTVPENHLPELAAQVEAQTQNYQILEEEVEVALALVKPDGFQTEQVDGNVVYTADITYRLDREHLLLSWKDMVDHNANNFGFHYDPYNFDSSPERDYFAQMLSALNLTPEQIEDIYFTGALTDPRKTDFFVEYLGEDGKWHRYSPDFVIRRLDGHCYIVEIKAERERDDAIDGENGRKAMATHKWVGLNPDKLKYEMIFTSKDSIAFNQLEPSKDFIQEG